jgi:autotransporter-associated beta strand protein
MKIRIPTVLVAGLWYGGLACSAIFPGPSRAFGSMTTTVNRPYLGIVHTHVETTIPRLLDMQLVEVDLDVTGIGFVTTPPNGSAAGETLGQTTRQFAASFGTQVAVNGGFSAWVSGSNYAVEGLAASRGTVYSDFQEFRTFALNISEDNVATIVRSVTGSGTTRSPDIPLYNTLPGEARLLRNGMIVQYENESLHPRTAIGLSADERRLFILTVDGRNPGHSLGVTRPELADFLRMFGAYNAMNLDGGGSSTLVFSDPQPRLVNVPVGVNNQPGSERMVGSNFGIYAPVVPPPADVVIGIASGVSTQGEAGFPQFVNALSLTKTGGGTLSLDVRNVFTGDTFVREGELRVMRSSALEASSIVVEPGGTLSVDPAVVLRSPRVSLEGGRLVAGTIVVAGADGIGGLAINGGQIGESVSLVVGPDGGVFFPRANRVVTKLASLRVNEAGGGGRVDLGAGEIAVAAGGISAADLRAAIIAGRNGGSWDGSSGIGSMAAAATVGGRAVGYVINADGSARVSFAAPGDADVNGQVDMFDLVSIASVAAYGTNQSTVWSQGDFNYDGLTNVVDLVGVNMAGAYGQGNYFPAAQTGGHLAKGTAVPEPATWALGVVVIGVARLLHRRNP